MQRKDFILQILAAVEDNSCYTPEELEEYKVNGDLAAISTLDLEDNFLMDELDYIEFIMDLEDRFQIEIPDDLLPDWYAKSVNIGDVADALSKTLVQVED